MNIGIYGAGLFGCICAVVLSADKKHRITLYEKENDIMLKASMCNHNRLHLGFHYPRSIETAEQSLDGLVSFFINFKEAIFTNFKNYYFIEKDSLTSPKEYVEFCKKINVSFKEEHPKNIDINYDRISSSILTEEPVFDFSIMKKIVKELIVKNKINIKFNHNIEGTKPLDEHDIIINTTYSNVNDINKHLGVDKIKLLFQDVVIPILEIKDMDPIGLTVMDGKFCSIMPMGFSKNKFLLYHVKESVLNETKGYKYLNDVSYNPNIKKIIDESSYYYPFLKNSTIVDYYRTIRALPITNNDARLSQWNLSKVNNTKVFSLISGKVSTCWHSAYELKNLL